MKRTLSDELLPTPSQQPQSELTTATLPNTTAEQTRSEPTLLNRTAVNPSIEMVTAVNQPPIQPSEHSTPEKSDRSSSASSSVSSATTDDEITLLQKAAWSGDAESQFRLGKCYISGKGVEINNEYALMWFTKADLQNHKESEIVMKAMYANGVWVDSENNCDWVRKAANQGHPQAQYELAVNYENGYGVAVDKEKAFMWYLKAADQGNVNALIVLGRSYTDGNGVKKDEEKAFQAFLKAAEKNDAIAQITVSEWYREGRGVVENLPLATFWHLRLLLNYQNLAFDLIHDHESIKLIPNVLLNHPELKQLELIRFSTEECFSDKNIEIITHFIRSNSKIQRLSISAALSERDDHANALVQALKVNTKLTQLDINGLEIPNEISDQIEALLTQNRDIAELHQYVKKHPLIFTADIPVDVVKILNKQIIVSYLKSGQTKEATKKAIDEFLVIASTTALANDSKTT